MRHRRQAHAAQSEICVAWPAPVEHQAAIQPPFAGVSGKNEKNCRRLPGWQRRTSIQPQAPSVWRTGTACERPFDRTSFAHACEDRESAGRPASVSAPQFGIELVNARAIPRRAAPACPVIPPPLARISTSNFSAVSVASSGCRTYGTGRLRSRNNARTDGC